MNPISDKLRRHYRETFLQHGATSAGVDWGADADKARLRYDKMLAVLPTPTGPAEPPPSLLDVGCGYGGLALYAQERGLALDYTGIDVAEEMIDWARGNIAGARFVLGDILEMSLERQFDYVACNGILTQKLDVPGLEMDAYAARLVRSLYGACRSGIVFNVMSTKVNFFSNNLYYRNPAEMIGWCMTELTPHVRLDHSYPLYEYSVYLYKQPLR